MNDNFYVEKQWPDGTVDTVGGPMPEQDARWRANKLVGTTTAIISIRSESQAVADFTRVCDQTGLSNGLRKD